MKYRRTLRLLTLLAFAAVFFAFLLLTSCTCPRVIQSVQPRKVEVPVASYSLEFGLPRLLPTDTVTRLDTVYVPRIVKGDTVVRDCVRVIRVTARDTVNYRVEVPADTIYANCPEVTNTVLPRSQGILDRLKWVLALLLAVGLVAFVIYRSRI